MDEVSYGADHKFLTCVANHESGAIVWATEGRNAASLQAFFDGLSAEQKAAIEKTMDGAVKQLHAAVDKVSADGTVTRDEAKQIKDLSEQLRSRMRAELKGKHASAKSKGGKIAKGKAKKSKAAAASKKAEK